ncbi:hypothetical protein PYW08_001250 [Mythimna loreyi]|uniref:Uncharacterized protein n=1 Tax=Mythimna loreyi TaxID=667449 RepID=A0ACC2R286_9NEOP|nr:hypothetical protein PYW08_001250 [Mythimna loreyi]
MVNMYNRTSADINPYDVRPSNSSREPTAPVAVKFDKDAPYYDMSGDKYLIILNHHTFEKTKYFKRKPSTRNGTYNDEGRLRQVFDKLGFLTFVFRNLKYQDIIDRLTSIATTLDRTRTSCVCITILTHGDKGGKVFAADQPYQLSEVMDIFGKHVNLINKPKLFFVQACRGGNMDPGHTVNLSTQCDSELRNMPSYSTSEIPSCHYSSFEEVMMIMEQPQKTDASSFCLWSFLDSLKASVGCWKDPDDLDISDSQDKSFLTVPTHADTLVVCSTVEDFLSYRDGSGSWMIQALCNTILQNHESQNLLDMIIQMNRTVAYEKTTRFCKLKEMNKKKQMPETRFTLTKHLKF